MSGNVSLTLPGYREGCLPKSGTFYTPGFDRWNSVLSRCQPGMIHEMRVMKGNGRESRRIFAPSPPLKKRLNALVPLINLGVIALDESGMIHGFVPGRGPVTNAMSHIGFENTLTMDIADFFDSAGAVQASSAGMSLPVRYSSSAINRTCHNLQHSGNGTRNSGGIMKMIRSLISRVGLFPETELTANHRDLQNLGSSYYDRPTSFESRKWLVTPQGFPTSPALANILAAGLDIDISHVLRGMSRNGNRKSRYTRYADDLTISWNGRSSLATEIISKVSLAVRTSGMKIKKRKTRLMTASGGMRMVTGIAVGSHTIHPSRKLKKRIRAAAHQGNAGNFCGLSEWGRLKTPDISRYLKEQTRWARANAAHLCEDEMGLIMNSLSMIEMSG
jgi:hypothetical protein